MTHFIVVFIAWLIFCSGLVTTFREVYTYATNPESQHGDNWMFIRWVWSAAAFTVWYLMLF